MRGDNLKHRSFAAASQGLGCGIDLALLRRIESTAKVAPNLAGKPAYIVST
jgi:hypothetical protein